MKYVCECCGKQLRIERGFDEDAVFEQKLQYHLDRECPKGFNDTPVWVGGQLNQLAAES
ncbi:MAG: hypothetical protein NVSMB31_06740 [Vulcanimicrobiaceae bacterium]